MIDFFCVSLASRKSFRPCASLGPTTSSAPAVKWCHCSFQISPNPKSRGRAFPLVAAFCVRSPVVFAYVRSNFKSASVVAPLLLLKLLVMIFQAALSIIPCSGVGSRWRIVTKQRKDMINAKPVG